MLRINAIGAGSVDYLLKGSGCREHERPEMGVGGPEIEGPGQGGAGYMMGAVEHGERAGKWVGNGLEMLGVEEGGFADEEQVRAIFGELKDPRTGEFLGRPPRQFKTFDERFAKAILAEPTASDERRDEIRREVMAATRRPVAYYDFTFSPVKSVSVYYASALANGDTERADRILAAHDAAVKAAVEHAEEHAYVRTGYHGRRINGSDSVGKYEKAEGLSVLNFAHSTSREGEPQLHTHAAVLNRAVTSSDGQIRALHGAGWRKVKEAMSTTYERELERNMSRDLGVEFVTRPDGRAREIAGVDPELMAAASTRRRQVEDHAAKLIAEYKERTGREPGGPALHKLWDTASLGSRKEKEGPQGPAAIVAWTKERASETGRVLSDAARAAKTIARKGHPDLAHLPDQGDQRAIISRALAQVQTEYSTWTVGNLQRVIDANLHDVPDGVDRRQAVEELVHTALTDRGFGVLTMRVGDVGDIPAELLRPEDGRPLWRGHVDETYTLASHVEREQRIVRQAAQGGAPMLGGPELELAGVELTAAGLSEDQKDAVLGVISSGRGGDVLIGPAGTGKSYTMARLADLWQNRVGGRVLGVAPSQMAADVLAADGVGQTKNTAKFLAELRDGRTQVRKGDLIVVDEAGMAATADLSEISEAAHQAGAKVLYTGDYQQLAAVDAGGMLELLATDHGAHELESVRRFRADWEKAASLQLREGDLGVATEYAEHGRLFGGTAEQVHAGAVRGYLADTVAGKKSLLIVRTNEEAAAMSRQVQEQLQSRYRVTREAVAELGDGNVAHVGDTIQLRLTAGDWKPGLEDLAVREDSGAWADKAHVSNRERAVVVGVDEDGRLIARSDRGELHLPTGYVRDHTTLGYAVTVHGAQGQTVDTARALLDEGSDALATYVAMTRGREWNSAHIVTHETPDEHEPNGPEWHTRARDVFARALENDRAERAATLQVREHEELTGSLASLGETFEFLSRETSQNRVTRALRDCLSTEQVAAAEISDEFGSVLAKVRQAEQDGHDGPALIREITTEWGRDLGDARAVGAVLHWRLDKVLDPEAGRVPEHAGHRPDGTDWTTLAHLDADDPTSDYARQLADVAAERREEIGRQAIEQAPEWAVRELGEVPEPDDVGGRAAWQNKAADLGAWREYAQLPDHQDGLGRAPGREQAVGQVLFQRAYAATGAAVDDLEFVTARDAELVTMHAAWERTRTWAPADVTEDRERAAGLAASHRQEVALARDTLALATPDTDEHDQAAKALADAQTLADYYAKRAQGLEEIGHAREAYLTNAEQVRYRAERAEAELRRRGSAALAEPEQPALFDLEADKAPTPEQPAPSPERTWHRPDLADVIDQAHDLDRARPEPVLMPAQDETLFDLEADQQAEVDAGVGPVHDTPAETGTLARAKALVEAAGVSLDQGEEVALAAERAHARRVSAVAAEAGVHQRERDRDFDHEINAWTQARDRARDGQQHTRNSPAPQDQRSLAERVAELRERTQANRPRPRPAELDHQARERIHNIEMPGHEHGGPGIGM